MTELERRALLGDKDAQKECTEKGIVLACPFCGRKWVQVRYMGWENTPGPFANGYRRECTDCHAVTGAYKTEEEALAEWNTRPAPPIGRCVECKHLMFGECSKGYMGIVNPNDFCNHFEPKEDYCE